METQAHIRLIEELNLNAWPALGQIMLDGWVLRFAEGYSRRANSANALAPGSLPPGELISQIEDHYRRRDLRSCVRITPLVPPAVSTALTERGYGFEGETIVMLAEIPFASKATNVQILPKVTEEWLDAYGSTNPRKDFRPDTLRKILSAMVAETGFAILRDETGPSSFAIGVLERGHLAILNVATHPRSRRQGHSKRVLESLYVWGKSRGAHTAHLNVQADNTPAVTLYTSLGFRETYRYVYRVKGAD